MMAPADRWEQPTNNKPFRTIGEVSAEIGVPSHVLRFWETKFPKIKPLKRGGGRRYYRPRDITLLHYVRRLLYDEGYTIRGAQRALAAASVVPTTPAAPTELAANDPADPIDPARIPTLAMELRMLAATAHHIAAGGRPESKAVPLGTDPRTSE